MKRYEVRFERGWKLPQVVDSFPVRIDAEVYCQMLNQLERESHRSHTPRHEVVEVSQ